MSRSIAADVPLGNVVDLARWKMDQLQRQRGTRLEDRPLDDRLWLAQRGVEVGLSHIENGDMDGGLTVLRQTAGALDHLRARYDTSGLAMGTGTEG